VIIKKLHLKNFRNYEDQTISFTNGINILYGENAQGKTNILEALYIAATGKSHRTNIYRNLIKYRKDFFEINLDILLKERESSIKIRYTKEKGRLIEINGVKRNKLSDIIGNFNIILFSPETLEVVKGPPSTRRKFIDILLCQTSRKYLYYLQQYNMLVKNKSIALKKGRDNNKYEKVLPVWNDQLAKYGGKISYMRMKAIDKINAVMKKEISQITDNKEMSDLVYRTFCDYDKEATVDYFENKLKSILDDGIQKEKKALHCIYGSHRDDFDIILNGMNSRHFCSQGQQRTLALSLILAELLYIEEEKGQKPVLLLDDVMSELDAKRQEYLLKGLYDVQTIITTTDDFRYNGIKGRNISKFYIENGCAFKVV
jgi:DNA replication and repair protein RecF